MSARRPATLRFVLTATTLALALLPTLLWGGAMLAYLVRDARARDTERNEALARAVAGEVRQFLEARRALADEAVLAAWVARARGAEAVRQALDLHVRANPRVQRIVLLDGNGRVVEAIPPDPDVLDLDLSRERYVRAALASGSPTWAIAEPLWSGGPVFALVVPGAEWTAVSYLDRRALQEVVDETRLEDGRTAAIVDRDGSFVAAADPRLPGEHVMLDDPRLREGLKGQVRSGAYRMQGREWLGSIWPVKGSGWAVLVSEPLEASTAGLRKVQALLLAALLAVATIAAAAGLAVARKVIRPVESLSEAIRQVEEGAYQETPPPSSSGYREVDDLAHAFSAMAAAVRLREEALVRSERNYRTLVDNSLVGVGRSAVDGTVLFCNEAMARFFGARSPAEVVGTKSQPLYRDPAQREQILAALEHHGRVTNLEVQARGRDGSERTLLFNVTRDGVLLTVLAVDISELKHAAADRERLEQQLQHAQKLEAVGRLAGGIAHDFNNLLTAIIGFAGMLKEELERDDPRQDAVGGILQAANRAANLTRGLLAYSRKQAMQPRPVDLCETIRTVDKLLRRIIGEDVELVVDLPARGLPAVADPGAVEQVLVNLCTNARDAMPGGGRLRLSGDERTLDADAARSRELASPGTYVRVRVEDSGRGMSPEVRARVFEPFYTTKPSPSGTGLGLSIVYGIVRQHGGHVELDSEPGRGTTVTLLFPRHEGPLAEEAPAPAREPPRGRETILLAEDEALVRTAVKNVLRGAGYEVVEAEDGEEAIARFAAHRDRIALCLLDVVMPRKNGREAAEAIAALRPGVPVLLASGYTADVLEERGHGSAGLEVIDKPFTPAELLRRVRERIDRG